MIYFNSNAIILIGISMICYSNALQVIISSVATRISKTQQVEVKVQYKNTNPTTVNLYKWTLPQKELDDPLFSVTRGGKPIQYIGRMLKRTNPTNDDVFALLSGQTAECVVDISLAYNMSKNGDYRIDFGMDVGQILWSTGEKAEAAVIIESKPVVLFIEGRQTSHADRSDRASFQYCSPSQQTSLNSAMSRAKTYASNAVSYFNKYTQSVTRRYNTWFGVFSSSRVSTVKSHMTKIQSALSTRTFTFDCSCLRPGVFAYVYPSMPYKIYFCNAFWTAPLTGTDSKAGTIIHEASHFTILGGTQDYAYGQSGAQSLASSNPIRAIMNADNHEYFCENTPTIA